MAIYSAGFGRARAWDGMTPDRWGKRRFPDRDIDQLRTDYVDRYGYVITVPDWEDVIHWKPGFLISDEEKKAAGRRQFDAILGSPSPNFARSYASVMTAIDNVQDAVSTGFMIMPLLGRFMPRIAARLIPYAGWALLGLDLLNLLNSIGRTPFSPMGGKRAWCKTVRGNPFAKKMQQSRVKRIKRLRIGLGNALEAGQVAYDATGVGLALGSIVGFVTDLAFGAYRHITGETVSIRREPPPMFNLEKLSVRLAATAPLLTTENPVFSEDLHHKIYYGLALSNYVLEPYYEEALPDELIKDPTKMLIPAPSPTNKITIEVIKEAGYSVEAGVRWPVYGDKMMPADELCDWQEKLSQPIFDSYLKKQKYSFKGMLCGGELCNSMPNLFHGVNPDCDVETHLEPVFELMTEYLRTPILFDKEKSPGAFNKFGRWVSDFHADHGQLPNVHYAKGKGEALGIVWKTKYSATPEGDSVETYPDWSEVEKSNRQYYMDSE